MNLLKIFLQNTIQTNVVSAIYNSAEMRNLED